MSLYLTVQTAIFSSKRTLLIEGGVLYSYRFRSLSVANQLSIARSVFYTLEISMWLPYEDPFCSIYLLAIKNQINVDKCSVIIPPAKRSFSGVYCFQPVRHSVIPSFRHSVIPSFRHSVNIWTSLLNNLSSFCLICFKFSPHLHHQTIHVWYEFRGQRVSIARVMGLFKSSYNMFAIVLKVHTL